MFIPPWALSHDKSVSICHSMFMCPEWVFCNQKPHPFGNKYHSLCLSESKVMLKVDMMEGKDCPKELLECEFEKQDVKTIGLLLCMLKKFQLDGMLNSEFDFGF